MSIKKPRMFSRGFVHLKKVFPFLVIEKNPIKGLRPIDLGTIKRYLASY